MGERFFSLVSTSSIAEIKESMGDVLAQVIHKLYTKVPTKGYLVPM